MFLKFDVLVLKVRRWDEADTVLTLVDYVLFGLIVFFFLVGCSKLLLCFATGFLIKIWWKFTSVKEGNRSPHCHEKCCSLCSHYIFQNRWLSSEHWVFKSTRSSTGRLLIVLPYFFLNDLISKRIDLADEKRKSSSTSRRSKRSSSTKVRPSL